MYNNAMGESRGLAGIHGRQAVDDVHELVYERLAFNTEQQMFEVFVTEVFRPAAVSPQ